MSDSILTSTKKVLGLSESDTSFDIDIVLHINSVFSTLNQLGIGPETGFEIEDATSVWMDFLENDARLNSVKSYIYLRVRLLFDPPTSSYHISALQNQVEQMEWRFTMHENQDTVDF